MSRGEWISFLDSDDWWDNNRMAKVVGELRDDIDLIYHPMRLVGKDGNTVRRGFHKIVGFQMRCEPLRHMALFGNPIPNSAAIVRRSCLEQIGGMCEDPRLIAYEDFDAWLRLVEIGARVLFLDQILGSYWIGDDAISAMSERQIQRQIALFERHISHFGLFRDAAEARQNYILGSMWYQVGNGSSLARNYLLQAKKLPTISMRLLRLMKLTKAIVKGQVGSKGYTQAAQSTHINVDCRKVGSNDEVVDSNL
jgi:hypothetical protein